MSSVMMSLQDIKQYRQKIEAFYKVVNLPGTLYTLGYFKIIWIMCYGYIKVWPFCIILFYSTNIILELSVTFVLDRKR